MKQSQQYPFFCPHKHLGFWLWCFFQITLPCIFFWIVFSIQKRPTIDIELLLKATAFGVCFIAIVNASTQIGPIIIDIKAIYAIVNRIAISLIVNKEAARTTEFWMFLTAELSDNPSIHATLINYLENYINTQSLYTLLEDEKREKQVEQYQGLLNTAKRKRKPRMKAEAIVNAVKQIVRRQHLSSALKQSGCLRTHQRFFSSP